MTAVRVVLSGSTNGRVIPLSATSNTTIIHTAHATSLDALYLWVTNVSANPVTLVIEWGGILNPTDRIVNFLEIFGNSDPKPIVVGQMLTNSLVVKAFGSAANALNASGFITRFTP